MDMMMKLERVLEGVRYTEWVARADPSDENLGVLAIVTSTAQRMFVDHLRRGGIDAESTVRRRTVMAELELRGGRLRELAYSTTGDGLVDCAHDLLGVMDGALAMLRREVFTMPPPQPRLPRPRLLRAG